ncbi:SAICAR synthase-like protein [Anaeromyces robustus]|uniref:SAICAR synthase-like protein n=1 Tax=Anaeromyces robustus TaxID=1754192 RepID=A0A1Y1WX02_9FUNG|nr:SAICAR synthase-like protein [Anaeromyces robustus]|eukprot:ORX77935.1 SAICAR synthase-like protein [Anaeromyces robustus]
MDYSTQENNERQHRKEAIKRQSTLPHPLKPNVVVDENHQSYFLVFGMLTGIKTCVVEAEKKASAVLSPADFKYCEKLRIDSSGKILRQGEKCDFEFKDYAPNVFKKIRELSNIDASNYIRSISDKFMLLELSSPGKSGSFFYFSPDYRYLIKTVHYNEHRHFFKVLDKYYKYLEANPNTLIMSIYGLYRLKADGHKMYFIVMQNVYPPNKDMHRMYDLKGSSFGRFVPLPSEEKNYARTIFKDVNWTNENRHLILGPDKRKLLLEQLEKDSKFLQTMGVMDYSLLVGIHLRNKGNSENIRMKLLATFAAVLATVKTKDSNNRSSVFERRMTYLPDDDEMEEEKKMELSIFNNDDGGFISTDEYNRIQNEAYYMGIIDYLSPWDWKKIIEHYFKTLILFQKNISAVSPTDYGKRFFKFVEKKIVTQSTESQPSTSQPSTSQPSTLQPSTLPSSTLPSSTSQKDISKPSTSQSESIPLQHLNIPPPSSDISSSTQQESPTSQAPLTEPLTSQ